MAEMMGQAWAPERRGGWKVGTELLDWMHQNSMDYTNTATLQTPIHLEKATRAKTFNWYNRCPSPKNRRARIEFIPRLMRSVNPQSAANKVEAPKLVRMGPILCRTFEGNRESLQDGDLTVTT